MKAISANLKFISGITRPLPENQYRDLYGEADRQRGRMASDGSATMKNERAGLSRLSALLFVGIAHYRKLSFMKPAAIADIEARTPSKRVLTSTPSGRLELQKSCETECRSARTPMIVPHSASSEFKKQYTRFSGNFKICSTGAGVLQSKPLTVSEYKRIYGITCRFFVLPLTHPRSSVVLAQSYHSYQV